MSMWRHVASGLRHLKNREKSDKDLADEAQHYIDQATEEFVARGMPPDKARRVARLEFGTATSIREEVRDYGWENALETFAADVRYAARRIRSAPGFTAVTVFILALGIGAATAIFSAVHPILIESLPYPHASRLVTVSGLRADGGRGEAAFGTYRAISERTHVFESIAAMRPWQPTMTSDGEPERLNGQMVSASYFRTLGARPALGRDFRDDEDRTKGPSVVILSDALWRRRFAGDPSVVGAAITLNGGAPGSVIGVMPPGFENAAAPDAQFWTLLQYDMSEGRAWGHHLKLLARLRAGVDIDQASRELNALWPLLLKEHPKDLFHRALIVTSLQEDLTSAIRPALRRAIWSVDKDQPIVRVATMDELLASSSAERRFVMILVTAFAAAALILAAAGIYGIVSGSVAERVREIGIRSALGASQRNILALIMKQGLTLTACGTAIGLVAAIGVSGMLATLLFGVSHLDLATYAGVILLLLLVSAAACGVPAVRASRLNPAVSLRAE
jgi:putative ABC transport system permease protein